MMTTRPIPWDAQQQYSGTIYVWKTAHFEATISNDNHSSMYTINDLSSGTVRQLIQGFAVDFTACERAVKEIIGKSYDESLGYRIFAGKEATTFKLADGKSVDLAPFINNSVVLTVIMDDLSERKFSGKVHLESYFVVLVEQHGGSKRINPERIKEITALSRRNVAVDPQNNRMTRTYTGNVRPGCTGRPGFMPNTVEHPPNAAICPVHES